VVNPRKREGAHKPYRNRVKPFGFLQHAPVVLTQAMRATGVPKINLVAPYGERRWWLNLHDPNGPRYRISAFQSASGDKTLIVGRSYYDFITAHPFHRESKSLGANGAPCETRAVGLLSRRPVCASGKHHVGKEANDLERVEAGLVDDLEEVVAVYKRDQWEEVRQLLKTVPVEQIMAETGYSRRNVFYLRKGSRKPDPGHMPLVLACAARVASNRLSALSRKGHMADVGDGSPVL
jgi:hypothetical protein